MLAEAAFCKLLDTEGFLLLVPWLPSSFPSLSSFPAEACINCRDRRCPSAGAYSQESVWSNMFLSDRFISVQIAMPSASSG